jgi:signal peptidase I
MAPLPGLLFTSVICNRSAKILSSIFNDLRANLGPAAAGVQSRRMADEHDDRYAEKSTVREYYEALLIAVIFVRFAAIFVFQAFKIPTGSMEDNLKVGDHIIVNKFIYGPGPNLGGLLPLRDIRRGDIIVFRYPLAPETDFVKRVIGLPGETVEVHDKNVYINGKKLDEPYVIHLDPPSIRRSRRLPEPYRSRDQFNRTRRAAGAVLRHGRQPRPLERLALLGHGAALDDQRAGIHGVLVIPRHAGVGRRAVAGPGEGAGIGVVAHFFTRTRWDRSFMIVDSNYHYHNEEPIEGDSELGP